jgi:hypothetical protein
MAHHWLHPVDLGHLSGVTDKTCRRGRNFVDILRIILVHANQVTSQDVRYRDICYISGRKVHRILAKSTRLARKVGTFNSISNEPDLASALQDMISL